MNEHLLTPKDVAERFQVSTMTVSRWAKDGTLPVVRIGKTTRFRVADVERLIAERSR